MKATIAFTTTFLLLMLAPFAAAKSTYAPTVSGVINYKTQVVKYTDSDARTRTVEVLINRREKTLAKNSLCNTRPIPTCNFHFGRNKNPALTKRQINHILSGMFFRIIVAKKPGTGNGPTYSLGCSTGLSVGGNFTCK